MPVMRSKSPRIEGGRCYPKLTSWGSISRGTLWGTSAMLPPPYSPPSSLQLMSVSFSSSSHTSSTSTFSVASPTPASSSASSISTASLGKIFLPSVHCPSSLVSSAGLPVSSSSLVPHEVESGTPTATFLPLKSLTPEDKRDQHKMLKDQHVLHRGRHIGLRGHHVALRGQRVTPKGKHVVFTRSPCTNYNPLAPVGILPHPAPGTHGAIDRTHSDQFMAETSPLSERKPITTGSSRGSFPRRCELCGEFYESCVVKNGLLTMDLCQKCDEGSSEPTTFSCETSSPERNEADNLHFCFGSVLSCTIGAPLDFSLCGCSVDDSVHSFGDKVPPLGDDVPSCHGWGEERMSLCGANDTFNVLQLTEGGKNARYCGALSQGLPGEVVDIKGQDHLSGLKREGLGFLSCKGLNDRLNSEGLENKVISQGLSDDFDNKSLENITENRNSEGLNNDDNNKDFQNTIINDIDNKDLENISEMRHNECLRNCLDKSAIRSSEGSNRINQSIEKLSTANSTCYPRGGTAKEGDNFAFPYLTERHDNTVDDEVAHQSRGVLLAYTESAEAGPLGVTDEVGTKHCQPASCQSSCVDSEVDRGTVSLSTEAATGSVGQCLAGPCRSLCIDGEVDQRTSDLSSCQGEKDTSMFAGEQLDSSANVFPCEGRGDKLSRNISRSPETIVLGRKVVSPIFYASTHGADCVDCASSALSICRIDTRCSVTNTRSNTVPRKSSPESGTWHCAECPDKGSSGDTSSVGLSGLLRRRQFTYGNRLSFSHGSISGGSVDGSGGCGGGMPIGTPLGGQVMAFSQRVNTNKPPLARQERCHQQQQQQQHRHHAATSSSKKAAVTSPLVPMKTGLCLKGKKVGGVGQPAQSRPNSKVSHNNSNSNNNNNNNNNSSSSSVNKKKGSLFISPFLIKGQRGSGNNNNNNNNNNNKKSGGSSGTTNGGSVEEERRRKHRPKKEEEEEDGGVGGVRHSSPGGIPHHHHHHPSGRSRRSAMKIGAKDETNKNRTASLSGTPLSRTRSGSRSSGGSSPATAGLHGRPAPHKTAVVAPAPSKLTPKTNALNRFGFRSSGGNVRSGESTDSVNSILSDAHTVSDSNSNIFDLCDDNDRNDDQGWKDTTGTVGDSTCNDNRLTSERSESAESPRVRVESTKGLANDRLSDVGVIPKPSPGGISQSNRITIFTRQLPRPQVVSVKSVSPKISTTPAHYSPKTHDSPLSQLSSNRTGSPSVRSFVHTPVRAVERSPAIRQQSAVSGPPRTPRVSRDSESSTRSNIEPDSGLGSSTEGERIRGGSVGVGGETETPDSVEEEESSSVDASDSWLKKTRQQQSSIVSKRKSREGGSMEIIQFNGTSSFESKRHSLEVSKQQQQQQQEVSQLKKHHQNLEVKQQEEVTANQAGRVTRTTPLSIRTSQPERKLDSFSSSGKDKRDSTITYGMARQKFAPYSRSRYGYGYQSNQSRTGTTPSSVTPSPLMGSTGGGGGGSSNTSGSTKIPGSSGLVRSRVAMIETPQLKKSPQNQPTPVLRRSHPKKPLARPTSLEKTPILVMPVAEKTVELSKPVCRRLEYSENASPPKSETQRESSSNSSSSSSTSSSFEGETHHHHQDGKDILHVSQQPFVEDILIVGSVEVETHRDTSNVLLEANNHGSFYENLYDRGPLHTSPPSASDRNPRPMLPLRGNPSLKGNHSLATGAGESKVRRDSAENEKTARIRVESTTATQEKEPPLPPRGEEEKGEEVTGKKMMDAQRVIDICKKKLPQGAGDCRESGEANECGGMETPDDSGIKLLSSPQSESSFEILESLSETTNDLSAEEEEEEEGKIREGEEKKKKKERKLKNEKEQEEEEEMEEKDKVRVRKTKEERKKREESVTTTSMIPPSVPEAKRESDPSSQEVSASATLPHQASPKPQLRAKPKPVPKPAENVVTKIEDEAVIGGGVSSPEPLVAKSKATRAGATSTPPPPLLAQPSLMTRSSVDLRTQMESSVESHKSTASVPTDSGGEHSNLSGKWTPTLHPGRSGDLDQDFLIDDEIADQPGLMFGVGSAMASSSFFTDDGGIFDDVAVPSPPTTGHHAQLKQVIAGHSRSRANSVDTTSSVGADDLMLDYFDLEEAKAGGYEEDVLSPDASEIFSEWTAMMAEVSGGGTLSERCVSRDGSSSGSIGGAGGGGGGGGGRAAPRPRLSSSSDLASPDARRPTVLRPPRQGGVTEVEGSSGGVFVDRTSYHYLCQDVTSLKTMLLRLRRILQAADTINPFDANLRNSLYLSLASSESPLCSPGINGDKETLVPSVNELSQENVDLRRQVVLLQQQLQEKDRTIRLLQQQLALNLQNQQQQAGLGTTATAVGTAGVGAVVASMASTTETSTTTPMSSSAGANMMSSSTSTNSNSSSSSSASSVNAATQTERASRSSTLTGSNLSRTTSIDDGLGPTVSSEAERNTRHLEEEDKEEEESQHRCSTSSASDHRRRHQQRGARPASQPRKEGHFICSS